MIVDRLISAIKKCVGAQGLSGRAEHEDVE